MIVHDRRDSSHGFFVPLVDYMLNRTSLSIVLLLLLFTVSLCFAQDTESLPDSVTVADSTLIEGTFTGLVYHDNFWRVIRLHSDEPNVAFHRPTRFSC